MKWTTESVSKQTWKIISIDCARKFSTNEQTVCTAAGFYVCVLLFPLKYAVLQLNVWVFCVCQNLYAALIWYVCCLSVYCIKHSPVSMSMYAPFDCCMQNYRFTTVVLRFSFKYLKIHFIYHEISKIYYHIAKLKLSPNCCCCLCCCWCYCYYDVFAQFPHFFSLFLFLSHTLKLSQTLNNWKINSMAQI